MLRLPDLVGSPLSLNALREDIQVSHKMVSNWVSILEKLYALFRLSPFGGPKIRAIKKSQKHYHMDWSLVADQEPKFENMVACHLLKWVHFQQDTQGHDIDLHYFRDTDGREVDFVISDRGKPVTAIECKWSDSRVEKNLRYWKARFPDCETWQLSATGTKDFITPDGIRVCHALNYLSRLV